MGKARVICANWERVIAEPVQRYFHCQLRCGYHTMPEAFMDTVKIYRELRPSMPNLLAPKKVAEILNPNLVL